MTKGPTNPKNPGNMEKTGSKPLTPPKKDPAKKQPDAPAGAEGKGPPKPAPQTPTRKPERTEPEA